MTNKQALKSVQLQDEVDKLAVKNEELENTVDKVRELVISLQSTMQAQQAPLENFAVIDNGKDE